MAKEKSIKLKPTKIEKELVNAIKDEGEGEHDYLVMSKDKELPLKSRVILKDHAKDERRHKHEDIQVYTDYISRRKREEREKLRMKAEKKEAKKNKKSSSESAQSASTEA
jgi:uncharacterized cupredoxin-like copper-binding protein